MRSLWVCMCVYVCGCVCVDVCPRSNYKQGTYQITFTLAYNFSSDFHWTSLGYGHYSPIKDNCPGSFRCQHNHLQPTQTLQQAMLMTDDQRLVRVDKECSFIAGDIPLSLQGNYRQTQDHFSAHDSSVLNLLWNISMHQSSQVSQTTTELL